MNAASLKQAWLAREPRERQALAIGAVVVIAMLGWAFVWHPLGVARNDLRARLASQQHDLQYMQRAAAELATLRAKGAGKHTPRGGQSLLALADASARKAGLGATLKRIEPIDAKRVRLEFSNAGFDRLATWLDQLQRSYGVATSDVSIDRAAGDGVVDARITLQEP